MMSLLVLACRTFEVDERQQTAFFIIVLTYTCNNKVKLELYKDFISSLSYSVKHEAQRRENPE